jgi:thioredoxin
VRFKVRKEEKEVKVKRIRRKGDGAETRKIKVVFDSTHNLFAECKRHCDTRPGANEKGSRSRNTQRRLTMMIKAVLLLALAATSNAFAPFVAKRTPTALFSASSDVAAPCISGEELEVMMSEWDTPLVIDAYATWCGPCVIMAPEFEAAAKDLKGKVRMVKLDTDKNEEMAARLNVQGLPTLLFLDKFEPKEGEEPKAAAVLKGKIEGAMRKDTITELVEYYFFDGPEPKV